MKYTRYVSQNFIDDLINNTDIFAPSLISKGEFKFKITIFIDEKNKRYDSLHSAMLEITKEFKEANKDCTDEFLDVLNKNFKDILA